MQEQDGSGIETIFSIQRFMNNTLSPRLFNLHKDSYQTK